MRGVRLATLLFRGNPLNPRPLFHPSPSPSLLAPQFPVGKRWATTSVMAHNLPNLVKPTHYDVTLYNFDLEKFTFSGKIAITLEELDTLEDKIVLNSHELKIRKASIQASQTKTESTVSAKNITYDDKNRTATLEFGEKIRHDSRKSVLSVSFDGILNNTMAGFYRSTYTDANGEKAYMFSSQCEACDARRIIPCFDEPALKATFASTLIIPSHLTALSNMPIVSEKPYNDGKKKGKGPTDTQDLKRVEFETTPIMSTYLLAYAIGDFEYIEGFTEKARYHGKRIPVRVYTTKGLIKQGQFALENATKIIDYFSDIFDIEYMLPKCDLLAVHEFSHGAMENWGLITYRSTALLFDEELSDSKYKIRVAYVVAHELAHQWFGNLVTMEWWNSLWLNEGFATWVGWLAIDRLYPEWDIWSKFTSEALQAALTMDSMKSSHAIEVEVNNALEIDQIFDAISYYKGSSCIHMLSKFLGVETFLKGVSNYLKKRAYGNATTEDLWDALSEASNVPVNENMEIWIKHVGYPVLTVAEEIDGIGIEQSRFLSTGDATEADQNLWWVPLGLKTEKISDTTHSVKVLERKKHVDIRPLDTWFYKLNDSASGVYRVNYPASRLETLGKQIASGHRLLNASDRISLVADAAALAISGEGSTTGFLSLAENFTEETNYFVWEELLKRLSQLQSCWYQQPEKVMNGLRAFSMYLVSKKYVEVGWEAKPGEGYLTSQLRPLLIKEANFAKIPGVKEEATRRFKAWIGGDQVALPPYLRRVVFGIVLGKDDASVEDYEAVLKTQTTTQSADAKETALSSIGDVSEAALVEKTIQYALSGQIPAQDIHNPFASLAGNKATRDRLWEVIKENWATIYDRYSLNMVVLARLVSLSLGKFSSNEKADDIEAFYKARSVQGFDRALNTSLDTIRCHARWVERDAKIVEDWFKAKGYVK